ncbi:hypothetical protein [Candidatus Contendibacter odensensis]|uniref:Glycosyltransferase RgtA/B/C/D-like domain-containing protein n=1 Tax=Candidatus Contendobacter odensis Run_B_J11 TaxID=1400861 RepID=A0A7U7G7V1_9GAMM|nr:hypothetical protein [Candidatus Contendobacter odensis]CDH43090.1 membrane hypothetical protein [Candidatus Contendobacter odensis Run_B_J11]
MIAIFSAVITFSLKMADEYRENDLPLSEKRSEEIRKIFELTAVQKYKPSSIIDGNSSKDYMMKKQGISLKVFYTERNWLGSSMRSFFGVYGYMNIYPHKLVSSAIATAFLFLVASIFILAYRRMVDTNPYGIPLVMMVGIITIIAASVLFSWLWDYQPQGRYLLAILPTLGGALVIIGKSAYQSVSLKITIVVAFSISVLSFFLCLQSIPKIPAQY